MAAQCVDVQFLKKFEFRELSDIQLSCEYPFENATWMVEELQVLKKCLNSTKSLLSGKDIDSWHVHTANTNRAGAIFAKVKHAVKPELLTQAWLKFYECLCEYQSLVSVNEKVLCGNSIFRSLHLCEAPGAFVTSLNHFLASQRINHVQLEWLASTLNPYYEGNSSKLMIDDDRFILHTFEHWCFGNNDTGNIMELCNADALVNRTLSQDISLVTADGSVDCMDNPSDQENSVAKLLWCETVTSLLVLRKGGSFLLKAFTFFEPATVSLLFLLRMTFRELHVFKPCSSKEGNSEVYVISVDYKRTDENMQFLNVVKHHIYEKNVDLNEKLLFSEIEIPKSFLAEVVECSKLFKSYQEEAILRNLALYNLPLDNQALKNLKEDVAARFMEKYRPMRIPNSKFLAGHDKLRTAEWKTGLTSLVRRTSLLRNPRNDIEWIELKRHLDDIMNQLKFLELMEWECNETRHWNQSVILTRGKSYGQIINSKFCHARILHLSKIIDQCQDENVMHTTAEKATSFNPTFVKEALLEENQSKLLTCFMGSVPSLLAGQTFEIESLPLLSRFAVSSLWIIAHLFHKVEFHLGDNPKICFIKYQADSEITDWIRSLDLSLLSFIDIRELCKHPFYPAVFRFNSYLLLKYFMSVL